MVEHYEKDGHKTALSFRDFSFWCYECDSYITNKKISKFQQFLSMIRFKDEQDSSKEEIGKLLS